MIQKVVVVVPCFNEEERLDLDAFVRFVDAEPDVDLLMVDDGSRDRTGELLADLHGRRPGRIATLAMPRNMGKAEAVRSGLLAALGRSPTPLAVGFWDADLATPLEAIPEFVRVLRERSDIEMVFGSRVNLLGRHVRRDLRRHWIGRVFATLASHTLRLAIYDTQCGAKLLRVTPDLSLLLGRPFGSRWIFDVELLARLVRQRRGQGRPQPEQIIFELPLTRWIDRKGSKLKWHDFVTVGGDLASIWWRELRGVEAPKTWASGPGTS
jgi:dolichyl-phosphate beta-glucosyltransferase